MTAVDAQTEHELVTTSASPSGYAVVAGKQCGPWSLEHLVGAVLSGRLSENTLVWAPGMAGWRPTWDVVEVSLAIARARATAPTITMMITEYLDSRCAILLRHRRRRPPVAASTAMPS